MAQKPTKSILKLTLSGASVFYCLQLTGGWHEEELVHPR